MLAPPIPEQFIEALRSRITEGGTISPYNYRPVVIPMQMTLGAAVQQGTATFTLPTNQRMLLQAFRPHVVPADVSAAGDQPTGVAINSVVLNAGTNIDVLYGKAQNCRIDLSINSATSNLFTRFTQPLSQFFSMNGEYPSLADMPGILVQGTNIELSCALTDIAAAGADTQYGLVLVGAFVQVFDS